MQEHITMDEIIALYQCCGIDTSRPVAFRNTINTGNISYGFNDSLHVGQLPSANADRLRWE